MGGRARRGRIQRGQGVVHRHVDRGGDGNAADDEQDRSENAEQWRTCVANGAVARPPSKGGDQVRYLDAFLDVRVKAMKLEEAHSDTSRVDDAQRVFLRAGNLNLTPPLHLKVYGDPYTISR